MGKALAAAGALQHVDPGHWQDKACGDQPWKHLEQLHNTAGWGKRSQGEYGLTSLLSHTLKSVENLS